MSQQTEARMVNGVNVGQLMDTIDAVGQTPTIASFTFRSENNWVDGGLNRSRIQNFYGAGEEQMRSEAFELAADEPPVLLGSDKGANPVEFVLHGLAACLTTSMVYHAAARGIEIEEIESRFEGDLDLRGFLGLDDKVRNGYENIRVTFSVKTKDGSGAEELVELAKQRSPVFDIVTHGVPVSVNVEQK